MVEEPVYKRQKGQHWSEDERFELVHLIRDRKVALFSKFNSSVTKRKWREAWAEVSEILNAHHSKRRDTKEVKKQWQNLKQQLKIGLQQVRGKEKQTGGERSEYELPALLEAVKDVLGKNNLGLGGIAGGVELPANNASEKAPWEVTSDTAEEQSSEAVPATASALFQSMYSHCSSPEGPDQDCTLEEGLLADVIRSPLHQLATEDGSSVAASTAQLPTSQHPQEGESEVQQPGAGGGPTTSSGQARRPPRQARAPPATPRFLRVQEVLQLNQKIVQLEEASLQARKHAAEAALATSSAIAETTEKVGQAADTWQNVSAAATHMLNNFSVLFEPLTTLTHLGIKKAELEIRALELEEKQRKQEIKNLELQQKMHELKNKTQELKNRKLELEITKLKEE